MTDPTAVPPAMSADQWKDLNGPMFFYGAKREDGSAFVYTDGDAGDGISITLAVPYNNAAPYPECFPIEFPAQDRHALAAICLYQQPYGFTHADVELLMLVKGRLLPHKMADVESERERLDNLADRLEALLPPDGTAP